MSVRNSTFFLAIIAMPIDSAYNYEQVKIVNML